MGAPFDGGTGWGRLMVVLVVTVGVTGVLVGVVSAPAGRAPA